MRIEFFSENGLQAVFIAYYFAYINAPIQKEVMAAGMTGQISNANARSFIITPL